MKKDKLLTSILSLALVLSLGACSETEVEEDAPIEEESTTEETNDSEQDTSNTTEESREEIEVVESTDVEDALLVLGELGVDTSSWTGINYHDYEENYETDEDDVTFYSVIDETVYKASELDSKVTGLFESSESRTTDDYTYSYNEYQYYDGATLYSNYFGTTSSQERDLSLSYFTATPIYYITYYLEYVASLSGYSQDLIEEGYEFTGSVTKDEDNTYTVYIYVSGLYEDYYWAYGNYYGSETMSLKAVYDIYGGLLDFDFEQYSKEYYPQYNPGVAYIFKESTTCSNYTESVDTPEWVKGE